MESQEHADSWATLSVHALSRAWTDTCENPILQGEALLFSPLYSGFSRKKQSCALPKRRIVAKTPRVSGGFEL